MIFNRQETGKERLISYHRYPECEEGRQVGLKKDWSPVNDCPLEARHQQEAGLTRLKFVDSATPNLLPVRTASTT